MDQVLSLDLPDEEFIDVFERAGFDRTDFPHRAHLRMAWLYVRHLGVERAIDRATAGIRAMAARHGQTNLYHDTLTRAWVYLMAAAVAEPPEVGDFDEYLRRHPELLDKGCLLGEELAVANHQVICGTVVAEGATAAPPLHRLRGEWL